MTISFEEKVYGITADELEKIIAAEYTTVESAKDEVPDFLESYSDYEAKLAEGIDLQFAEEQVCESTECNVIDFRAFTYEAHNFGGDAA